MGHLLASIDFSCGHDGLLDGKGRNGDPEEARGEGGKKLCVVNEAENEEEREQGL